MCDPPRPLPAWSPSGSMLCDPSGRARRQVEAMYRARRHSAVQAAHRPPVGRSARRRAGPTAREAEVDGEPGTRREELVEREQVRLEDEDEEDRGLWMGAAARTHAGEGRQCLADVRLGSQCGAAREGGRRSAATAETRDDKSGAVRPAMRASGVGCTQADAGGGMSSASVSPAGAVISEVWARPSDQLLTASAGGARSAAGAAGGTTDPDLRPSDAGRSGEGTWGRPYSCLRRGSAEQPARRSPGPTGRREDSEGATCDALDRRPSGGPGSGRNLARGDGVRSSELAAGGTTARTSLPDGRGRGEDCGAAPPASRDPDVHSPASSVWRRCVPAQLRYRWQQCCSGQKPRTPAFWLGFKEYGVDTLPRLVTACRQRPEVQHCTTAARRWLLRMRGLETATESQPERCPLPEGRRPAVDADTPTHLPFAAQWRRRAGDWWRHLRLLWCPAATPAGRRVHQLSGPCECEQCAPLPPAADADSALRGGLADWWAAVAALVARLGQAQKPPACAPFGRVSATRLSRAEKSEVLTEDLVASERRVEAIRVSCSVIRKRLTESLSGHGADDAGKRLRKMQEHQLGVAMKDGATHVGTETMLGAIMAECGEAQTKLAEERLGYERELEQTVLESSVLQQLLDNDIPNVTKLRKTLAKLTLDMDASRSRYQNAQRHSAGAVGAAGSHQKVETARDELEAAQVKVEQHRDVLAGDMFQLLSREPELAQLMLHLVKLQTEYYRSSLLLLEAAVPELQASLNAAAVKPVFGLSLEEHLRVTGRQVALPLEMCVCRLLQIGADEEGLFRVAGSTSKARKLKSCFDAGLVGAAHMLEYSDPHVVADALKAYLRDLPDPLMTTDFYDEWMSAAKVQDEGQRLQALWQVLHQLPETHYCNLRYLVKFLALLSKNKQVNKMTTQNIAIVMAPNLLWTRMEEGFNMTATGTHSLVVDALIAHSDWFFPEEVDFFITYPREVVPEPPAVPDSPVLSNGAVRSQGHHRSKSSDSGVVAVDSAAAGESSTGSTASLTSSDPSVQHCESPRPTLRRKKQAAPPPPTHRQTIAAASPARPVAEPPPPRPEMAPKTEPPASRPEAKSEPETSQETESGTKAETKTETKAETKAETKSETKPEINPETKPESKPDAKSEAKPETKPDLAPKSGGSPSSTGPDASSRPLADLVQKSAAIAAAAAASTSAAGTPRLESTRPVLTAVPCPTAPPSGGTANHADPAGAPVPAPRCGQPPSGKTARPDRPPPPAKVVERAASFSPSDGGVVPRQKPALPERPGTLKRTPRNSTEVVAKDSSSEQPTPPAADGPTAGAPPPIGWAVPAAEPRPRSRPAAHPSVAPPPVPAPRTAAAAAAAADTTHL